MSDIEYIMQDTRYESNYNRVRLSGKIIEEFNYSHQIWLEKFYSSVIEIQSSNGEIDFIPIVVSEALINKKMQYKGKFVEIGGVFTTIKKVGDDTGKYDKYVVLASYCYFFNTEKIVKTPNIIYLEGIIIEKKEENNFFILLVAMGGRGIYRKVNEIKVLGNKDISPGDTIRMVGKLNCSKYEKKIQNKINVYLDTLEKI